MELHIEIKGPYKVWCDNMSAIKIAHNPIHHNRTKHVEIDRHFITKKVETKVIDLTSIPSKDQIADIMTKPLAREHFEELSDKLGMINMYSPT